MPKTEMICLRGSPKRTVQPLIDSINLNNAVMAEIGVYLGESTVLFAKCGKFQTIYAIDIWKNGFDPASKISEGRDMALVEADFDDKIKGYPSIKKMKMLSVEAASMIEDESLDLIYIDGSHLYEDVKADILAWTPKVKIGGIISGHDYTLSYKHGKQVTQAVNELLGTPEKCFPDFSWTLIKK